MVIEAEINPELNKCEINSEKVDILIYVAAPMVVEDQEFNFNLYLIPISKNISEDNINVEVTIYPDRVY